MAAVRVADDEIFPRLADEGGRAGQSGIRHSAVPDRLGNDRAVARPQGRLLLRDQPGDEL